jgi:hypothetical protein
MRAWLPRLLLAAGLALLLAPVARGVLEDRDALRYGDFDIYWSTARFSNAFPGVDIYTPAGEVAVNRYADALTLADALSHAKADGIPPSVESGGYFQNLQSPFLVALMSLLPMRDLGRDYLAWQALSLAAFFALLLPCLRKIGFGPLASLAFVAAVVLAYGPFSSDVGNANLNRLLLSGLLASSMLVGGPAPAALAGGVLLGLGVMAKPSLVLAPLFLFAALAVRSPRALPLRAGAGFLGAVAAAALFAAAHFRSPMIWWSWAARLQALSPGEVPLRNGNFALPELVRHATGYYWTRPAAAFGVLLALGAVLAAFRGKEAPSTPEAAARESLLLLSMGCLAFLLCASLVWIHYYLLALPAIAAAWAEGEGDPRAVRLRRGLLLLSFALMAVTPGQLLLGTADPVVMGALSWAGALLAGSAGIWVLSARKPAV